MKQPKLLAIEACPGFVKDTSTGAILNTDNGALSAYKARKRMMRQVEADKERIASLEEKIDRLEQLLLKVLDK